MAPKFKHTKEEIVETGFKIVRASGWSAFTARSIADELGSSSRPIYSFFSSLEQLEEEIVKRAVALLHDYMTRRRTGEPWIDHGIGYVIFAHEEKKLFQGINDEKHIRHFKKYGDLVWQTLTSALADYAPFRGLSPEQIKQIQVTRWLYAHGLAFQVSNPMLEVWDETQIVEMMMIGSKAIYDGLMKKFGVTTS
ncbi:MAG: hypothetical protein P8X55_18180 [Desulfosarcinaceae bacterium]|jgi:AcrR family transcriptional regulator